ncbi:putative tRNA adenosine deaminase-associated protein [Naumannella halotolerans]|uniref:Putative tRNA adenosine deaminase-associated protein n=2 Tax=Naumannella halotolerans TaxID=993414 RepID=A0A4R7IWM5_9ACTN|nr:putative tRNA adenosine deaminase-associated protein [Naumannella halotolerans]
MRYQRMIDDAQFHTEHFPTNGPSMRGSGPDRRTGIAVDLAPWGGERETLVSDYDSEDYESFQLGRAADDAGARDPDEPEIDPDDEDLDDDAFDEPEDATADEIDLVVAAYREDGMPVARALDLELANDLEELIVQLRRLPGDAGAIGFVSLVGELIVLVRVRGRMVQTVLSDGGASEDWPIARDVADYLNENDIDSDDFEPIGDLGIFGDIGISDFELEAQLAELEDDADSVEVVLAIAERIGIGPVVRRVVDNEFS